MSPKTDIRSIVLFDGYCYICSWLVGLILTHDRRNAFVCLSLQSSEGENILERYPAARSLDSVVLVNTAGVHVKSEAVIEVLTVLGGRWRILTILKWLPVRFRDSAYDFVARIRYRLFGRRAECLVPPRRFIPTLMPTPEELEYIHGQQTKP